MDAIIKLIPSIIKQANYSEELCESASFVAWRLVTGHSITQVTAPKKLIRKTLLIAVVDQTWKKELEKMSSQLLFQINTILGSPLIKGFDFYIAPTEVKPKKINKSKSLQKDIPLDPVVLEGARKITDPSLQERFLNVAGKYLEAQKERDKQMEERKKLFLD